MHILGLLGMYFDAVVVEVKTFLLLFRFLAQSRRKVGLSKGDEYRKVASSRPVYYSILESFDQRSQYIRIAQLLIFHLKRLTCESF